jgi:hypothetical protein
VKKSDAEFAAIEDEIREIRELLDENSTLLTALENDDRHPSC